MPGNFERFHGAIRHSTETAFSQQPCEFAIGLGTIDLCSRQLRARVLGEMPPRSRLAGPVISRGK
jgi:hypothetical protein